MGRQKKPGDKDVEPRRQEMNTAGSSESKKTRADAPATRQHKEASSEAVTPLTG